MPAVMNAADEVAVAAFLADEISFLEISEVVAKTLDGVDYRADTLEEILSKDKEARAFAASLILALKKG